MFFHHLATLYECKFLFYEDELFHQETGGHEEEQMLEQQRNYLHRDYVLIKRAECNK